jgi:tetratricopeptide (TPR) repeat protein
MMDHPSSPDEHTPPSPCQHRPVAPAVAKCLEQAEEYTAHHQWEEAKEALLLGMEAHPQAWQLPHALGQLVFSQSGDAAKAIILFEQATHFAPRQAMVWADLAKAYEADHQEKQALEAYRQALTCDAPPIEAFVELARFLEERGLLEEAASALEEAIASQEVQPPELGLILHLHRFYVRHDAHENALTTLEQAQRHYPKEGMLLFLKGVSLDALERTTEAEAAYTEALRLSGESPELHLQMAQYFTSQGDELKAIQHLVVTLEHAPQHLEALEALAQLLMRQGLLEQALQVQERLVALTPKLPRAWVFLGELQARLSQPKQAIDSFNHALEQGASRGLELRKCVVAPLLPPETEEERLRLEDTLFLSLKSLSLNPPRIENPAIDVGVTPREWMTLGVWNDRLQQVWESALSGVTYQSYQPSEDRKNPPIQRVMLISRGISSQNEMASLWLPAVNTLDRTMYHLHWLNLSSQGTVQATLPAGVALPEAEQVMQIPSYEWQEIQQAVLEVNPDVLLFSDAEGDCVSQALRLWPKAPPSLDIASLQLPVAMLPPLGVNTKRFKQDFGAPFDYPLCVVPMNSHALNSTTLTMIQTLLHRFPEAQCVMLIHEAPAVQALMQARVDEALEREGLASSRVALMRLPASDRLRLLQLADAVIMPCTDYMGMGMLYLSMVQALHFGTPVYRLGHDAVHLPFSLPGSLMAPLWNTPTSVEALMATLADYLNHPPEAREAMRPQRQAMASVLVSPKARVAQMEALVQAIQATAPVIV